MTAPTSRIPKGARPFQGRPAGLATRILAGAIDGIVLLALLAGGYAVWAAANFLWSPAGFHFPTPSRLVFVAAGFLAGIAYLTLCWWISGRTFGDQVIGLRVVGRGGLPFRFVGALIRATVCVVFPLGLLWAAVSRDNRSVADLLLRTSVVYDWQAASATVGESDGGESDGAGGRRGPRVTS